MTTPTSERAWVYSMTFDPAEPYREEEVEDRTAPDYPIRTHLPELGRLEVVFFVDQGATTDDPLDAFRAMLAEFQPVPSE